MHWNSEDSSSLLSGGISVMKLKGDEGDILSYLKFK